MSSAATPSAPAASPTDAMTAGARVQRDERDASRHGAAVARRNAVTSISGVIVVGAVWASAELARSLDFPERSTKAVIAAVVAVTACIQITLGLAMSVRSGGGAARRTLALRRLHRWTGAVTLAGAAFVTYLCMTGPFPGGPTLHRVVGFAVCAIVLVKITVVTNQAHRRILVAVLGVLLGVGLICAFLTNGIDVLRSWS